MLSVIILGLCLLELDVVDLVHKALLHLGWYWNMDVYNVSILLSELVVVHLFQSLIIVCYLTSLRMSLAFMDCLTQLIPDLILKLLVCHDGQVVEGTWRYAHFLELLSGVGMDREWQLNRLIRHCRLNLY